MRILLLLPFLISCTTIEYRDEKVYFKRTSFGSNVTFNEVEVVSNEEGGRKISAKGYSSEQTEAMEKISEGMMKGAIKGIKPF